MKTIFIKSLLLIACFLTTAAATFGQEKRSVIFAVVEQGKMVEPVAFIKEGHLVPALDDNGEGLELSAFAEQYYTVGKSYQLISGGKATGKTTIVKHDPGSECGAVMATVKTTSPVLRLTGSEMALATDFTPARSTTGLRRNATPAEKAAIEKLIRAEFAKQLVLVKNLKPVKLTALDINNDKVPEFIGTYQCSPAVKERAVMFFIAAKNKSGVYVLQHSEVKKISEEEVMSGDITHVDEGIYQEQLLDILDTGNSGVASIFTTTPSFEGVGFTIYQHNGNNWKKVLDISNYHCAY